MPIKRFNPATLEFVGEVEETGPEEVPRIVAMARTAQGEWKGWPLPRRMRSINDAQAAIISDMEGIAKTVSEETGKPRIEAINADILTALGAGDYSARMLKRLFRPQNVRFGNLNLMMSYLGRSSYIQPRPVGVVGIISPWNYPFGIPYSQTIMAVAAGNAVVLKPSSETPLTALKMGQIFEKGDFPKGLVQVIPGSGGGAGEALVSSGVDRLIFTGSTAVGKRIMERASHRLTPVTLELGGKDPFVVFEDADLDRAVDAAVWGSFVNAGQTCVCVKRIYVQKNVYPEFLARFRSKIGTLKQGYGWDDPGVSVGPVINEDALREMEESVLRAVEQGGRVSMGGKRASDMKGYFFQPTVIVDAPQDSDIVQEETFGPVVSVSKFDSEQEAIELANDCRYALSGSVWTSDLRRGRRVAEMLSGGTVLVNNVAYTYGLASTPWGGRGDSGFGRTHGQLGFGDLLEPHHVHVDTGRMRREVWWHPYDGDKLEAGLGIIDMLYRSSSTRSLKTMLKARRIMKGKTR